MTRSQQRWVLLAAGLVYLLYGYPGYLTTGGVDQLVDSRVGSFTDWAPSMMTEIWRLLGLVWSGPAGMFVLQGALVLLGCRALLVPETGEKAATITAACLLLFPPVLASLAVIWPESQFVGYALAGTAALAGTRKVERVGGIALLFLACGMGGGAIAAVLPLVIWQLGLRWRGRRYVGVLVAVAVWAMLVVAATTISSALVDHATSRDDVELAMTDVVGVLSRCGPMTDAQVQDELANVALAVPDALQQHAREGHLLAPPSTPEQIEALLHARIVVAREHPGAYVAHRWHEAVRILGLTRGKRWLPVYSSFLGERSQHEAVHHLARHSAVQRALVFVVRGLSRTLLFHPYVYGLLALLLLVLATIWRRAMAAWLLASGLVGEAVVLVVGREPAVHCSLWLITTTVLATALLIRFRMSEPRS